VTKFWGDHQANELEVKTIIKVAGVLLELKFQNDWSGDF
jgi:hypothetical protein